MQYREDTLLTPDKIEDADIRKIAEAAALSGYELWDLRSDLKYHDDYPDRFFSSMIDDIRPESRDVDGIFFAKSTSENLTNNLVFKIDENGLKDYLDGIVKSCYMYDDEGKDLTADDCFTKNADGSYTWTCKGTDYKITYDAATSVCQVYAYFYGGVG